MRTLVLAFIRRGELSVLLGLLRSVVALALSLLALSAGPLPMKIGTVVWFGYAPFYFAKLQDVCRRCGRWLVRSIGRR